MSSNIAPPVVSGRIAPNSASVITTVIGKIPYYLTSDVNGIPFFMQFQKNSSTSGLDTFVNYALQVIVVLSVGLTTPQITFQSVANNQYYIVHPGLSYVGAPDPQSQVLLIPLTSVSGADNGLLAVGRSYTFMSPIHFLVLNDNITNPNAVNITTMSPSETSSFFVTQVKNLVDTNGNPATVDILPSLYSYYTGTSSVTAYFFTSAQDAANGSYIPYSFCPTSVCGPNCIGPCGGDYTQCKREVDNGNFSCSNGDYSVCTWSILSVVLVIYLAIGLGLGYFLFQHQANYSNKKIVQKATNVRHENVDNIFSMPHEGGDSLNTKLGDISTTGKVVFSVILIILAFVPLMLFIALEFFPSVTRSVITTVCSL